MALPGVPLAAIVPMALANRLTLLDRGLRKYPETAKLHLILFRAARKT
jgi:hypothetical protein